MEHKNFKLPKWGFYLEKFHFYLMQLVSLGLVVCLVLGSYLYFNPVNPIIVPKVDSLTYEQSVAKFDTEISTRDGDQINDVCKSKLLNHNQKTEKVIVLFHGFTNCPAQFSLLGQKLFDLGYNVYIPRIPHHGLKNTLTDGLENLKASELVDFTAESVQVATGLGNKVTLFGLSGGGVLASFGGYFYSQVKNIYICAPLFAPNGFDGWQLPFVINLLGVLPSEFTWWDSKTKEKVEGPSYAYPRFSSKAALAFITLSYQLKNALEKRALPQSGKRLALLTVENDQAVNNSFARNMINDWMSDADTTLIAYQFSASKVQLHDFVDPNQKKQNIEYTYPVILEIIQKI